MRCKVGSASAEENVGLYKTTRKRRREKGVVDRVRVALTTAIVYIYVHAQYTYYYIYEVELYMERMVQV